MQIHLYARYRHTLKMAYRQQGIRDAEIVSTFPEFDFVEKLAPQALVAELAKGAKRRLNLLSEPKGGQILDTPGLRRLTIGPHEILIPLVNQQGVEWYSTAPPSNFDFLIETQLGLLDGAEVIYDFGAHHGVWSMYYALIAGPGGRVTCFEPSIINVEVSAMLFLVNGGATITSVGAAIGAGPDPFADPASPAPASASHGMLVDFVSGDLPVVDLRDAAWERAGFLKMDIEGFEHDVIVRNPWIFDLAENMHIEVHIPHMIHRGLDYRQIIDLIPFDQFTVVNYQDGKLTEIVRDTPLSGYCSLMMKRRGNTMI